MVKGTQLGSLPVNQPINEGGSVIQMMAGWPPEILHQYQRPPDMGQFFGSCFHEAFLMCPQALQKHEGFASSTVVERARKLCHTGFLMSFIHR